MEENYDKSIFFKIPYGIFLVTATDEEKNYGCIVNTFIQLTDNPVLVSFSLQKESKTAEIITKTGKCNVGLASEEFDMELIAHFGKQSGYKVDKFASEYNNMLNYELSPSKIPAFKSEMLGNIECDVTNTLDLGTHYLFILKISNVDFIDKNAQIMTYDYYRKNRNRSSLINTHNDETNKEEVNENKKADYVCTICHYIYDGDIPFEELPDTYLCPVCGKPKGVFVRLD